MIWSVKPSKFQGQSIDDETRVGFPLDVLRSKRKFIGERVSLGFPIKGGDVPGSMADLRARRRQGRGGTLHPGDRTDSGRILDPHPLFSMLWNRRAQPEIRKKLVVNGCDTCTATKKLYSFLDIKWPNCLLWPLRYFEDILKALFHSNCMQLQSDVLVEIMGIATHPLRGWWANFDPLRPDRGDHQVPVPPSKMKTEPVNV